MGWKDSAIGLCFRCISFSISSSLDSSIGILLSSDVVGEVCCDLVVEIVENDTTYMGNMAQMRATTVFVLLKVGCML